MSTTLTRNHTRVVRIIGRRHAWNGALNERLEREGLQVQNVEPQEAQDGNEALTLFDFVGEETPIEMNSVEMALLRALQSQPSQTREPLASVLVVTSPTSRWHELLHSIEPLLSEGRADFVRLSPDDAVKEDAWEEVVQRAQLLLQRRALRSESEAQRFARRTLAPFPASPRLLAQLHNEVSGRMDAKRVAAFFGLPLSTLAKLLGVSSQAAHKTPDAPSLQSGLAPFHFVASALLGMIATPEDARIWLHAPNDEFDDETPLTLIKNGEIELVTDLLRDALMGQPG